MKKVIIGIAVLLLLGVAIKKFVFPGGGAGSNGVQQDELKPLSVSKNSAVFNTSFETLLNSYFSLKDAIANYDTAKANIAARQLGEFADSLKLSELRGDSTGAIKETAVDFTHTITGAARQFSAVPDFVLKKRQFQVISEGLYNLTRTVKYDRQELYHQHCPMAFNDEEEAWWLSNSNTIDNPYLGKKHPKYKASMEGCGDITDSLDFSKSK